MEGKTEAEKTADRVSYVGKRINVGGLESAINGMRPVPENESKKSGKKKEVQKQVTVNYVWRFRGKTPWRPESGEDAYVELIVGNYSVRLKKVSVLGKDDDIDRCNPHLWVKHALGIVEGIAQDVFDYLSINGIHDVEVHRTYLKNVYPIKEINGQHFEKDFGKMPRKT